VLFEAHGEDGYTVIRVENSGKLYASVNKKPIDLTSDKSDKWWSFLYDLALKGVLPVQQTIDDNTA
jgi:hypothetical protein